MNDHGDPYAPPFALGEPLGASTVGTVLESRHKHHKAGDFVVGPGGWQQFSAYDAADARKLPINVGTLPMRLACSELLVWRHGLLMIGKPKSGETLVVGAASGAVGSVVGQIAKLIPISPQGNKQDLNFCLSMPSP